MRTPSARDTKAGINNKDLYPTKVSIYRIKLFDKMSNIL